MARSSAAARVALALSLSTFLASAAAAEGLYLHGIPTTIGAPVPAFDGPLRVRVSVASPRDLAKRLPGVAVSMDAGYLVLDLTALPETHPQIQPVDPAAFRGATFMIDFDEPELVALRKELVARHGAKPSLQALRTFTSDAIPRKTMERGWDLASRVAGSGVGDCTEHAVLLTALARSVSRPARVVTGVVVVKSGERLQGFGHAWAELYEGGRWVVADATPIADEADALVYLPTLAIEDEGPGYVLALGVALQRTGIRKVDVSAAAVPASVE